MQEEILLLFVERILHTLAAAAEKVNLTLQLSGQDTLAERRLSCK